MSEWKVCREGWDRWVAIWPWMDAATKAYLQSRGYTVERVQAVGE